MNETARIALSELQHWMYCPRQRALIRQEQAHAENVHTLRGRALHMTVDTPGFDAGSGYRAEHAPPAWNVALGLIGKADTVAFYADGRWHFSMSPQILIASRNV